MGNLGMTIANLIRCNPGLVWIFTYFNGKEEFKLDTRQIREELRDIDIADPRVMEFLKDMIEENLKALTD